MDEDTKTLLKQLNDKVQDDKTENNTRRECIDIMIKTINNYDLTNKPCKICPSCNRLKHISLYPITYKYPGYTFCRLCELKVVGNVKVRKIKCDVCNIVLTVHEDLYPSTVIKQHNKGLRHQRRERGHY